MFHIIIHWIGTFRNEEFALSGTIIENEFVSIFARSAFSLVCVEVLLWRAVLARLSLNLPIFREVTFRALLSVVERNIDRAGTFIQTRVIVGLSLTFFDTRLKIWVIKSSVWAC